LLEIEPSDLFIKPNYCDRNKQELGPVCFVGKWTFTPLTPLQPTSTYCSKKVSFSYNFNLLELISTNVGKKKFGKNFFSQIFFHNFISQFLSKLFFKYVFLKLFLKNFFLKNFFWTFFHNFFQKQLFFEFFCSINNFWKKNRKKIWKKNFQKNFRKKFWKKFKKKFSENKVLKTKIFFDKSSTHFNLFHPFTTKTNRPFVS